MDALCGAVQAGGLGMVAIGLTQVVAARFGRSLAPSKLALPLCVVGLLGVFAVGYAGYFVFDAIWPSYYYSPIAFAKNLWLIGQGVFMALYFAGAVLMFGAIRPALDAVRDPL